MRSDSPQAPAQHRNSTIDVLTLALNALWIVGLAILLATISYHAWLAAETSRSLRDVWSRASWTVPVSIGAALSSIGFGFGLATRLWERVMWTAIAAVFAYQALRNRR